MRRVLIDDDEAVACLRHDVVLVHLRADGAERAVDDIVVASLAACSRTSPLGASSTAKGACIVSAKPVRRHEPAPGANRGVRQNAGCEALNRQHAAPRRSPMPGGRQRLGAVRRPSAPARDPHRESEPRPSPDAR